MKNLIQIGLVVMLQFIACYLGGWDRPETGFILVFVLLWQGLFIWLFHQISKKHNTPGEYKFSKVIWYIIMPICSLISPMLSLMIFIFGTLCDLRIVSQCISIREWIKYQVVVEESDNNFRLDFESVEFSRTNPATGLPMSGGVDIGGNSYGCSSNHHYR
ncbi:surface exclusion protein [Salmonella enterica subsp. enterica serovar Kottbus]|uniref:Surface exclusion protein n=2 Tax=Salmonella enterica TaxID=28901 RepID=A0A748ASJ3_SALER|nr:surface exclusion protein [Salmonella enterica]EAB6844897.1 surface exclusion protein [Salmonella enterica subsp. salamae]EAB6966766.1 surface exclusion protein [Salmonella enterica subsp. enterica serovar Kottbus]EBH9951852.1 surface exclusion protein [Salmonella enterica subsp. enterica serovar Braenderup]EBV0313722.1 surface exclusion protein [Salmonella enterica subsp. enterica serovar Oranienburg]EBX7267750.1 surface exclusion protein [Salmonella enterica subsp. enterica serovar Abony]